MPAPCRPPPRGKQAGSTLNRPARVTVRHARAWGRAGRVLAAVGAKAGRVALRDMVVIIANV